MSANGTVDVAKVIDWDTVIANAQKHPEQSATNNEIGIDMYGNPVNLDLWNYEFNEEAKTFTTGKGTGSKAQAGYIGNIVNGRIIGEIPQYIKNNETIYTLVSMANAFKECEITIAPLIPKSVTELYYTFSGCSSLTTAPTIPDSVINMEFTFSGCSSLTTAPTIPDSVINMGYTFSGCSSLTTAPTIPDSVTNMYRTFTGCVSLTGNFVVNALNVESYGFCLQEAATNDGCNLVVSGTCPQLDDIIATKSENSHITKGN